MFEKIRMLFSKIDIDIEELYEAISEADEKGDNNGKICVKEMFNVLKYLIFKK